MKTVIEMARSVGAGEPASLYGRTDYIVFTKSELERFAELVRADEREATLNEIAKWLEGEKDAPYWAELVRTRGSNT